jgi:hypothetical protein
MGESYSYAARLQATGTAMRQYVPSYENAIAHQNKSLALAKLASNCDMQY